MVNHPDTGEMNMTYDAAGNLLTKLTAELRKSISDKGYISYTYDFERLHEVLYPENLFNRVTYTYGKAGYGYIPNDTTKEETFFYHSDHLGSTSYITDEHANITQYDAYLPYGELLVDEHSSSEDLPYKFNGKQFDEETGLYYYGARYLNPVTSLWYGVDPLTEKYPSISGYIYCAGNPVKFIDIQGLDLRKVAVPANKSGTKFKTIEVDSKIAAKVYTFTRVMNKKYGTHFKNNPDLVHFYGNETDYGYKSRDEAIEVNDIYKNKHGDNIPLYTPEPSNDTQKKAVAVEQHQKYGQKKSNKEK